MVRFTKAVAKQLITFVKRIEIYGNYWDPNSTSAYEFARQMGSPNLKKSNPNLHVELFRTDSFDPPRIRVEYSDGSSWDTNTFPIHAVDLRNELYSRATDVEDSLEDQDPGNVTHFVVQYPSYFPHQLTFSSATDEEEKEIIVKKAVKGKK